MRRSSKQSSAASPVRALRVVLGDQLNPAHSWYSCVDPNILYVLMETRAEATYVPHHIQKLVGFFAAMRLFAEHLQSQGHRVHYCTLDDPKNAHSFTENLRSLCSQYSPSLIEYQEPDEWRVDQELSSLSHSLGVDVRVVSSEHFLTTRSELRDLFRDKRSYLMEPFYRHMRMKTGYLMVDGKPLGGRWNYDAENRSALPPRHRPPPRKGFAHDVSEVFAMVQSQNIPSIGSLDPLNFRWPLSRADAQQALTDFCEHFLPSFGRYQDAMHTEHRFLYHSLLSFALNTKMISPTEVCELALETWQARQDSISLSQIEGFVRQIIGWREYMRGIYWTHMPKYRSLNVLNHTRALPPYFWTGETQMNCVRHAVRQSLEEAYAHHIQRLMITGNFCLLAGIDPAAVDEWYLGIYIDAIEWVEITNTRGMSQHADGGIVATKPYISSAQYIKKMSNYCQGCTYDYRKKTGEGACPFNSLYWHFYDRHRSHFERNPRVGMMYRVLGKMDPKERSALLTQAKKYLDDLNAL
jgi:deoxyribodipyrimidine photolyase-related protein